MAQKKEKRFEALMILNHADSASTGLQQKGILYEGDQLQISLVLNDKKWDSASRYYIYLIELNNSFIDILYPNRRAGRLYSDTTPFPDYNKNRELIKKKELFNATIDNRFLGPVTFLLVMTENPIKDYDSLIRFNNNKEFNVKEECLKLIKGSRLSYFYKPEYGNIITQAIQIEGRPEKEKSGLVNALTIPVQKVFDSSSSPVHDKKTNVFALNDSSEIFYTPVPQDDIIRDSFPMIDIIEPQLDSSSTKGVKVLPQSRGKKVKIRGIAVDKLHNIKKITVDDAPPDAFRESSGYFDYLYTLKDGLNITNISVENSQGYKRTIRVKFQYTSKTGGIAHEERDYLFVIGINNYKNLQVLHNATKDARDFKQLMLDTYGYKKEHTIELFDSAATKRNIMNELKKFIDSLDKNDRLLVYYSGHGFYDDQLDLGYWLPVNAFNNQPDEYVDNLNIARYIQKMHAKNIFLIADACYSGSLLRDMRRENDKDFKSRIVLCSGKLKPVPDGVPGTNSPFAQKVLEFLKAKSGGRAFASDMIDFIKKSFPPTATQRPVGGILDEVGDENGDFIFEGRK